jgi:hypothetical protein
VTVLRQVWLEFVASVRVVELAYSLQKSVKGAAKNGAGATQSC